MTFLITEDGTNLDERIAIKERPKLEHRTNYTVVSSLFRASSGGVEINSSLPNSIRSDATCLASEVLQEVSGKDENYAFTRAPSSRFGVPQLPLASQSAREVPDIANVADHSSSTEVRYPAMVSDQNLIAHLKNTLNSIIKEMDSIDQNKLAALRLGTELRGLLGKAQDEFLAYESSFVSSVDKLSTRSGLTIALQNFASSLSQLPPLIARIQQHRTLFLNKVFKRETMFAFQEINSYYTSAFIELSMAIGSGTLSTCEAPTNEDKVGDIQSAYERKYSEQLGTKT